MVKNLADHTIACFKLFSKLIYYHKLSTHLSDDFDNPVIKIRRYKAKTRKVYLGM